ncbi:MAG: UTP--glucose-1-phosphate uridylyltransferase GalU [Thermoplasmata archaeon]|nr:MAG: UTP--glucose-1-phosphate uridylyltransferase GalU [Thermoplasmata archaeon]
MKAVIPAAGLGTRFIPASKAQPKEMLPVVDKPVIQYVIEEAVAAGINDILIITGRGKRSIEDHFDKAIELEQLLRNENKDDQLKEVQKISNMADIHFVRQKEQKGLGHAIYCARKHVGNEPFAVMLGDTINIADVPLTKQLMNAYEKYQCSIIAIEKVPREKVVNYGIIDGEKIEDNIYKINNLVEKPSVEEAPSTLGITGTYVLTPEIFKCIERTKPGVSGEIQLTDAMKILLEEQSIYGLTFEGKRYDIGNKLDWFKANIELTLKREEFAEPMKAYLKRLLND